MPENQKKTPCSRITKRNPDSNPNSDTTSASDGQIQRPEMAANGREIEISKPNSDTTPASDGQIQRPEMTGNGREIEISELTFRQQAALPSIAPTKSLEVSADCGIAPPQMAAYGPSIPRTRESTGSGVNVGYPSRPPNSERYRRVALRLTIRLRRWYVFRWLTGARAFCGSETRRRRITTASIMSGPGGAPFNPGQERLPSAVHGPSPYLSASASPS